MLETDAAPPGGSATVALVTDALDYNGIPTTTEQQRVSLSQLQTIPLALEQAPAVGAPFLGAFSSSLSSSARLPEGA